MSNYFGYDIFYVMNITDIDDKIIKRARQQYLYDKYVKEKKGLSDIIDDATQVVNYYEVVVKETTDPDKKNVMQKLLDRYDSTYTYLLALLWHAMPTHIFILLTLDRLYFQIMLPSTNSNACTGTWFN